MGGGRRGGGRRERGEKGEGGKREKICVSEARAVPRREEGDKGAGGGGQGRSGGRRSQSPCQPPLMWYRSDNDFDLGQGNPTDQPPLTSEILFFNGGHYKSILIKITLDISVSLLLERNGEKRKYQVLI